MLVSEVGILTGNYSHSHFDHIGDMTTFPVSTELVVGPGFAEKWLPGFPTITDAPVSEEDMAGRAVRGINFDGELKAGPFPAHDFFGDGSFYLLDAPGHCLGHLARLARTSTNPDTFIMMAVILRTTAESSGRRHTS
jgi:glyoxylase-like metal-dependent hydrolase (beta-lactamase superfamily II)